MNMRSSPNNTKSLSFFLIAALLFQLVFASTALCKDGRDDDVIDISLVQHNNTLIDSSSCLNTDGNQCPIALQDDGTCEEHCDHCGHCHNLLLGPAIWANKTHVLVKSTLLANPHVLKISSLAAIIYRPPIL
ncbi:hypothetical protein [Alteromonas sp. 14N.309.X.WAT.G.H12]|uniref:hypothetical protein n=1 Tax=Alteromonas sp. 14N.309.X.WAT.G.H12 TaxID=3120824 RepID=UPI002FD75B71